MRLQWILLFVLAAVLWSIHIDRPVDLPSWHEFDYASIARNFVREGGNILYPRIDWRGDGPGYTEMEFPIIPWSMAELYKVVGVNVIVGRLLSLGCMLMALFVFTRIACNLLTRSPAFIASLFFVFAHEVVQVASAIQPESLMLLLSLSAVYFFIDWYDKPTRLGYGLAAASFAGAMLVKSPAAHLAIFFLLYSLYKEGVGAFRRPSLYLFAALSLVPVIWWYAHAASLWHQFHNSMGVSNEDHWLGLDLLKRPKVILNLLSIDVLLVLGGGGLLVVLSALKKSNSVALMWCIAVAVYLLVILRTSGAYWAAYYHVVAVPPLALLFGSALASLSLSRRVLLGCVGVVVTLSACMLAASRLHTVSLPGVFQDLLANKPTLLSLGVVSLVSILVTVLCCRLNLDAAEGSSRSMWLGIGCVSYFYISTQLLLGSWTSFANRTPQYGCLSCFWNKTPANSLIVATGGPCADASGHRVANDAPNMFYWLDRKGFTTCQGNDSISELNNYANRGAKYFVVDKDSLRMQPAFEYELRNSYALLAECQTALLFQLREPARKY